MITDSTKDRNAGIPRMTRDDVLDLLLEQMSEIVPILVRRVVNGEDADGRALYTLGEILHVLHHGMHQEAN